MVKSTKHVIMTVDELTNDIVIFDVDKLNVKDPTIKQLKRLLIDCMKDEQEESIFPEYCHPSNLDYSQYKEACITLPHRIDHCVIVKENQKI